MHRFRKSGATLAEAKEWLQEHLWEGAICPCCGRPRKVYTRKLDAGMARDLIVMYRQGGAADFLYTPHDIDNSGTLSKMAHWELIEMGDARGWWRITPKGVEFIKNRIRVPRSVVLWNGRIVEFDDSVMVSIQDALGDKFDYEELMAS